MCCNRTPWHFRNCFRRCCQCCRNGAEHTSAETIVTIRRRFLDVPMQTFFGPGFTERDILENIDDSLQTIAHQHCR